MQLENYEDYDNEGETIPTKNKWNNVSVDLDKVKASKFTEQHSFTFGDAHEFMKMDNSYDGYLNAYDELNFFAYKYQRINGEWPNVYRFEQFDVTSFVKSLFKNIDVPLQSYVKVSHQDTDGSKIISMLIAFDKNLVLYIDGPEKGAVYYTPKDEFNPDSQLHTLLSLLKTAKRPKVAKNKIYVVYKTNSGFEKTGFNVTKRKMSLDENYNDDFLPVADKIIKGLNDKHKSNLVILTGGPGTGKTSFIRYLTSKVRKNIIFISPDMVQEITDPSFIPFLIKNSDAILIIEDGEPAVGKRDSGERSSAVSNLLNLTDGLLSDCLRISIVITLNTNQKNIDEALQRKGRMLMSYNFDKLCSKKTDKLLSKLGHNTINPDPMTLADIYFYANTNSSNIPVTRKQIGFRN